MKTKTEAAANPMAGDRWEKRYRGHSENGEIPKACAAALWRACGGGE